MNEHTVRFPGSFFFEKHPHMHMGTGSRRETLGRYPEGPNSVFFGKVRTVPETAWHVHPTEAGPHCVGASQERSYGNTLCG